MSVLVFADNTGSIGVKYKATLKDPANLNEQFFIDRAIDLDTYREMSLFYYWTQGIPWTLNEMIFFCINNELCLGIYNDDESALLQTYGICGPDNFGAFSSGFSNGFS